MLLSTAGGGAVGGGGGGASGVVPVSLLHDKEENKAIIAYKKIAENFIPRVMTTLK
jgi:hypothetical protein